MMPIMIMGVAMTLVIVFIRPKWGSFLIWLILFTYPHGWWYYRAILPLNMGVDDLFCIFLFLVVVVRRNLIEGIKLRLGYEFWAITAFSVIVIIANIAGSRDVPSNLRIGFLKDILKMCVIWGLFYAIIHCIDNEHDLKQQFTMFSVAAIVGAFIVVLQYFYPYQTEIFSAPAVLEKAGSAYEERASGAFMNANTAANVIGASTMLLITALRLQRGFLRKSIIYGMMFVMFAALAVTRSRSGLLAIVVTFGLMAFWGSGKKVAWFVIVAGVVIGMAFSGARQLYTERLSEVYDPAVGVYGANVEGRFATWKAYIESATAKDYILGKGFKGGIEKNGMESHSVYVSLLTVYGFGGVVWAIIIMMLFFKRAFFLRRFRDSFLSAIGEGSIWAVVSWCTYGLASDALSSTYSKYLLFYVLTLVGRAYNIALERNLEPAAEDFEYETLATTY
jgi:hypothetical protein